MIRKIIQIDQDKCNGCGACASACHEGAIGMVDGKATLLRDDYCDGLGDCLPTCPVDAIHFVEREALAYDEEAVKKNMEAAGKVYKKPAGGCPGSRSKSLTHQSSISCASGSCNNNGTVDQQFTTSGSIQSHLSQWPVQIKLAPVNAPYFENANLLIAADCTAYAYGNFHNEFIKNRVTLIGCPKLDEGDYTEKLTQIIQNNQIKSLTVVRMEVPCCGGLEHAAVTALKDSGKFIPWQVVTLSTDGRILPN